MAELGPDPGSLAAVSTLLASHCLARRDFLKAVTELTGPQRGTGIRLGGHVAGNEARTTLIQPRQNRQSLPPGQQEQPMGSARSEDDDATEHCKGFQGPG